MNSAGRLRSQRHTRAMVALDNFDAIADRVQHLLAPGRRITIVRRYLHSGSWPEVQVGLTLDPEAHGGGLHIRKAPGQAHIGVSLKPGLTSRFGIGAYSGEADTEEQVWARYHTGDDDSRRNMTLVVFTGGLSGWEPMLDDQLVIRHWNSHGACDERVIAFDTPAYWAEREALEEAEVPR